MYSCGIGRSWPGICDMRPWILLLARKPTLVVGCVFQKAPSGFTSEIIQWILLADYWYVFTILGKWSIMAINVIFPRLARSGNDGNVYVIVYVRSTKNITVQYGDPYRSNIFNLGVIFLKLFSWPLCKGVTLHSGDPFDSENLCDCGGCLRCSYTCAS